MAESGTLVGLVGRKRSGKSTFAEELNLQFGFRQVAFADKLKSMLLVIDPLVMSRGFYVYDLVRLSTLVNQYGWEGAKENPEVRRLLQVTGTEGVQHHLGKDAWVKALFAEADPLLHRGENIVVSDVRFPHEADAIQERDGILIRIVRPFTSEEPDHHVSETGLDFYPCDAVVKNIGTLQEFQGKAAGVEDLIQRVRTP